MRFLPAALLLLALVGCGSEPQKVPTAQEAQDFKGKPITAEQKAHGMAAAMGGAGGANAKPAPGG